MLEVLQAALTKAVQASLPLPPGKRLGFVGKALLAEAEDDVSAPALESERPRAEWASDSLADEMAALAKEITAALNAASADGLEHPLRAVSRHILRASAGETVSMAAAAVVPESGDTAQASTSETASTLPAPVEAAPPSAAAPAPAVEQLQVFMPAADATPAADAAPAADVTPAAEEETPADRARRIFDAVDTDGSGHVDLAELKAHVVSHLGEGASEDVVMQLFATLDADQDGRITAAEWVQTYAASEQQRQEGRGNERFEAGKTATP